MWMSIVKLWRDDGAITGSGALNVVTICDFGEKNNLIVALEEKTEDNQCLEVINVS